MIAQPYFPFVTKFQSNVSLYAARIRAFLYEGVEKFHMTAVVEAIPTLLHMSVFLFFIGLVDFMFAVNSAIAYIVLGTLVACASLYITITILPAIRLQCPYRTPMSGIFWRFLECLKFIWELRNGIWMAKYLSIEGSMADDRVALASEDSPELHLRDLGAMRWTLASLTEDSELEPFVEGIALVLAPFHDQVAHEPLPLMVNSIRNLLIDQDLRLFDRIVNLLMSTRATHSLREEQRRRRAFSCMDAITSLCHIVNSTSSLGTWYTSQGLAKTLAALKVDPIPEIALAANNTTKAVTHRLLSDLSAVSEIQEPSWWGSSVTRELLSMIDDFGCMDAVFEQIKGFSPDSLHRSAEMPIDLRRLIELVRSIYIPDYLAKATQLPSPIPSDRRRRLVLCLETIYTTAGAFPCNQSTSEAFAVTANALVRLRQEDSYDISFYANWAATRIAYHIQCDIIRTACITHIPSAFSYYEDIFGNYFEILCALDTIPSVGNSAAKQQLNLGVESPGLREFRHSMTQLSKDKISDFISLTTSDEQQAFETFQLWSTGGVVTSDFILPAKVILSQGHVGLVIGFLYSIQGRVLDDDLLDLTLDILTLLTRHLTACFSNNSAQTILARLVGAVAQNLHANAVQRQKTMDDHLDEMFDNTSSDRQSVSARKLRSDPERHGTSDVILKIIQTLFHLLGTIGDPESLPIAKAVLQSFIDDPMTLESVSEEALSTLTKVRLFAWRGHNTKFVNVDGDDEHV